MHFKEEKSLFYIFKFVVIYTDKCFCAIMLHVCKIVMLCDSVVLRFWKHLQLNLSQTPYGWKFEVEKSDSALL